MSTSGSTSYNPVRDVVIRRALRLVHAYQAAQQPRPDQVTDALDVLNMMIKSWQIEGLLWLKQFVTLNLTASQASYVLGPDTTETIVDESSADYKQRPFRILQVARRSSSTDILLTQLTLSDYIAIPNKSTSSTVNSYCYDPKITNGMLYVWPVSSNSTDQLVMLVERSIEDVIADTETFDFHPEWLEALCYNLADRIAPEYSLPISEQDMLTKKANYYKELVMFSSREQVPAYFTSEVQ